MPLKRETWITFHQPSRSRYQPNLRYLKILPSKHLAPLKKLLDTKHFFNSFVIFLLGHIPRFLGLIHLSSNIVSTHGMTLHPYSKIKYPFTYQRLPLSKLRSRKCVKQVSYTPLCIPLGFPILFPLRKNKVPFASVLNFVTS